MTWADFYLVCFFLGFGLSAVSLLLGSVHLHIHLPHLHLPHGFHSPHLGPHAHGADLPWFNFGTIAAFLAWFGGTGYLLQLYHVWAVLALGLATVSGVIGATIVFLFLARVLLRREAPLNPADYDMTGVLGHITIPIRTGGTGEIVYSQEGVRRCAGARSENGVSIPKGTEVMVTRYEKGIAYVTPWEDPIGEMELHK